MAAGTNVSEMIAKMNKVDLKDQDEKKTTAEEGKDGKQAEVDKKEAGRTHKDSTTNRSNSGRRSRTTSEQQRRPSRPRLTLEERQKKDQERLDKYMEEQKTKKVLETGCKGTIKWYSLRNKYGFIGRSEQDKGDVFVHQMAILNSRERKYVFRTLEDGEPVEFDIVEGRKGPEAANVTGPDGGPVHGVRFRIFYVRSGPRSYLSGRGRAPRRRPQNRRRENDGENAEKDGEEAGANKKPRNNRRRGGRGTSNGKEARDEQDGNKESKKQNKDTDKASGDKPAPAAAAADGPKTVEASA